MPFDGSRRLVVLGCGAIGSGLFVYEAQRTGAYARPLVVDVDADLVAGLRANEGHFHVNIARPDRVEVAELGPVEVADASIRADRARIVEAIAEADELATALPSVASYRSGDPGSPHRLLSQGLAERRHPGPLLVLCAENHRRAAGLLAEAVLDDVEPAAREGVRARARFVDTVIGKMSGVIEPGSESHLTGLATITPTLASAFLVEEFDRILVSRADPDGAPEPLHPGLPVLREVDDLAPFEDAKLLGHNATHTLAGFLGSLLSLTLVAEMRDVPGAMDFLRSAFIEESGRALIARHAGADPLFTTPGFSAFADDLLARMVNPWLADTVARAVRDPRRKLGWEDRLVGLIRLGLAEDVPTPRYAMGAAAGLEIVVGGSPDDAAGLLTECWPADVDPAEAVAVLGEVARGGELLTRWRRHGFTALTVNE